MLTLSANFAKWAGIQSSRPMYYLLIEPDAAGVVSYRFKDLEWPDSSSGITWNPGGVIASVTPVARSRDPMGIRGQIGQTTVSLVMDDYVRGMVAAYPLKGAKCTLKIGFANIAASDFAPHFVGIVDTVKPTETNVELVIKDIGMRLYDARIKGADWVGLHPLQIASRILTQSGITSAWYDTTSFDPSEYAGSYSHWAISRADMYSMIWWCVGVNDFASAEELYDDLMRICLGTSYVNEDGKITFKKTDLAAAALDNWTSADIGDFEIETLDGNLLNHVSMQTHPTEDNWSMHYTTIDNSSSILFGVVDPIGHATEHNYVCEASQCSWITGRTFVMGYGNPVAAITSAAPAAAQTFYTVGYGSESICGCGNNTSYPSVAQPAWAQLSNTRTAYLMIGDEIIECSGCVDGTGDFGVTFQPLNGAYWNATNRVDVDMYCPFVLKWTVKARGALGTTAADHPLGEFYGGGGFPDGTVILDMTIPVAVTKAKCQRFSSGGYQVSCTTSLAKYAYQLGDVVTLTTDRFMSYAHATLTTATKWEIIGKDVDLFSEDPRIKWTLLYLYDDNAAAFNPDKLRGGLVSPGNPMQEIPVGSSQIFQNATTGGLVTAPTTGLGYTVSPGSVVAGLNMAAIYTPKSRVATVSKDTYVYVSALTGGIAAIEVANGAAAPSTPTFCQAIAKVVSDGAGITSVADLRNLNLVPLDKVSDGATYKKVVGVSSANQVQAASIADAAVAPAHTTIPTVNPTLIPNHQFNAWTRG